MGGGAIPVVASGCGVGGTVAWTYVVTAPSPVTESFQIYGMAAGPMGHVAVGSSVASADSCQSPSVVLDASGAVTGGPSDGYAAGSCAAYVTPGGFDPSDGLLYRHEHQSSTPLGPAVSGFVGEAVSASFNGTAGMGPFVFADFMGADAAGNLFARVQANGGPTGKVDFGLGPVSGTVMLHYDPTGVLVSDSLPTAGTPAVGAFGHLFYARSVTGTIDEGCGTVGAASVTSTVLTKRDATGACLWSKALPASLVFALDPSEDVLLATTFSGTIDFGGGPLTSVGTSDLAIAKLDGSGGHVWSKRFGASGASVTGVSALGATNGGGAALAVGIDGAVDFGCGAVSSSAGATTLFARFDATGTVIYSRVVGLLAGYNATSKAGPVVDGLGGISYAVQVKYQPNCACATSIQCANPFDSCIGGMCQSCLATANSPGNIVISRFAP
jgi:hypothetical protein